MQAEKMAAEAERKSKLLADKQEAEEKRQRMQAEKAAAEMERK